MLLVLVLLMLNSFGFGLKEQREGLKVFDLCEF